MVDLEEKIMVDLDRYSTSTATSEIYTTNKHWDYGSSTNSSTANITFNNIKENIFIYYHSDKKDYFSKIFTATTCREEAIRRVSNWGWMGENVATTVDPRRRMQEIIRERQSPIIIVGRNPLKEATDTRETRARQTLRRLVGEAQFVRFLKRGFVSVKAKSGLIYQVFPGHGITAVWKDGKIIEKLCIVLRGNFPPTDSVIMRFLMIANDEAEFRKKAISHGIGQRLPQTQTTQPAEQPQLITEWRRLKAA